MPTSADALAKALQDAGLTVHHTSPTCVEFGMKMAIYRGPDDAAALHLAVEVLDDGRYARVLAPYAFQIEGPHRAAALEACLRFQWSFRLVRLEFDHRDGELRPCVHLPVLDGMLTVDQIRSAVGALCAGCDTLYPLLQQVLADGRLHEIDDEPTDRVARLASRLAEFTQEEIDLLFSALIGDDDESHRRGGEPEGRVG